jgi:hypothetical protein
MSDYPMPLDEYCTACGNELYSADCWNGCDDGYFDGYEEDPLYYDIGEFYACYACHGHGSIVYCPCCEKRQEEKWEADQMTATFC